MGSVGARWHERLRADLPASLVVVLVAVPLSLGIAVASGAPVIAGLISAVIGGVVAGALGGSAVQVSGPAAGLTLIVAQTVAEFGWRGACAITAAAGIVSSRLPAPLAAVVAGTAMAMATGWDVQRVQLPGEVFTLAGPPMWPAATSGAAVAAVGAVALVASVETLLAAMAPMGARRHTRTRRHVL
jgi:MFS superfamily sulfate permease-like transporter